MVSMRNGFPQHPSDTSQPAPQQQDGARAQAESRSAKRAPAAASPERDVHSAPTRKARPLGTIGLPKLSAPGKLSDKTSALGSALKLDEFVTYRADVRQLRRLYDEGGLGEDFAIINDRVMQDRYKPGVKLVPITQAISAAISQLRAERAEQAARAWSTPVATAQIASAASTPRNKMYGQPARGIAALRSHTARIRGESQFITTYANDLRDDVIQLCTLIKDMLSQGVSSQEIVALPEIKRSVRVLANERALLQKDCDKLHQVRANYSEAIMATQPRELDDGVYKRFEWAVAIAGELSNEDARGLLDKALVAQLVIEEPATIEQMSDVAHCKHLIASHYLKSKNVNLSPSDEHAYSHIDDAELLERLAGLLAGSPSYIDIKLRHPLYERLQMSIQSFADLEEAHAEVLKQANLIEPLLYSDSINIDNATLPRLLTRLVVLDRQLTGKQPLESLVRSEARRLIDERKAIIEHVEQMPQGEQRAEQMGEAKRIARMLQAMEPAITYEQLLLARAPLRMRRSQLSAGAARDKLDREIDRIEAQITALAPSQPRYIARSADETPDPEFLDEGGFDDNGMKFDDFSHTLYDRSGRHFDGDLKALRDHDDYFL